MKLHTGMFYTYQDQYGWAVATFADAPREAFLKAHGGPRTFATQSDANKFIEESCK